MAIEYPLVSLTEFMFKFCDKYQHNTALVELDTDKSVTYKELKSLVIQASRGFQELGIKEGDVVCIYAPNCIYYAVSFYALCSFGAILQCTNPLYTPGELKAQLEQCSSSYVITVPSLLNNVQEVKSSSIKKVILIGGDNEDCVSFESLLDPNNNKSLSKSTFDPKTTVAVYIFSSGTTGLPKAVQLSHYNLVCNLIQLEPLKLFESDTLLVFLPLFHIYGLVAILSSALTCGCKMILMSRFLPVPYMAAIEKYQVSVCHVVPPVMVLLAKMPETKNYNLTCVRKITCGAAPLSRDIEQRVKEILQVSYVTQGYGMSEVGITHLDTEDRHKLGSVGQVLEGVQHKVIDTQTGDTLGNNQQGEICFKGPQLMLGYLNNPEQTEEMISNDGWAKSGDIGYIDEDGYLFLVDRIKELIKYKGHQVAPAELEAMLLKHPDVADAGVVGVADPEAGELPRAFVVLKKNASVSAEDLQNYVKEHMAPHKRLRGGVEFIDLIPKSLSGKILRRVLRERLTATK